MFHLIRAITTYNDCIMDVLFTNGERRRFNMLPLVITSKHFKRFEEDPNLFFKAEVGPGGYGVVWDDTLDLSCDFIYNNSTWIGGAIVDTRPHGELDEK